jgi:hypothetical protein
MRHNGARPEKIALVDREGEAPATPSRKTRKRKRGRRIERARTASARTARENEPHARMPSIMRIRRLIMAALRVWELKQGIHEGHWLDFDQRELIHSMDDL